MDPEVKVGDRRLAHIQFMSNADYREHTSTICHSSEGRGGSVDRGKLAIETIPSERARENTNDQ